MLFQENETDDLLSVLKAVNGFTKGLGIDRYEVNVDELENVLRGMRHEFPANGGEKAASAFKKVANFFCYFIAQRPCVKPFPESKAGPHISRITNHQNAMVGFCIVKQSLNGATIMRTDGVEVVLEQEIGLSKHSYVDFIQATANITPSSHFHIMSLFFEQLAYRFNPSASYKIEI